MIARNWFAGVFNRRLQCRLNADHRTRKDLMKTLDHFPYNSNLYSRRWLPQPTTVAGIAWELCLTCDHLLGLTEWIDCAYIPFPWFRFDPKAARSAVSDRLRSLIEDGDCTAPELAGIAGVKEKTAQRWIRGETIPDTYRLALICWYLGCSFDYMCGLTDHKELPKPIPAD